MVVTDVALCGVAVRMAPNVSDGMPVRSCHGGSS
jgi:hypothetical protein